MKEQNAQSLNSKAIGRFKRNKTAMFGLVILAISLFIALFAYVIAPDNTSNANNQIVQIKTSSPNFNVLILRDIKDEAPVSTNWLTLFWKGKSSSYIDIPIVDYTLKGQKIFYREYRGEGNEPIEKSKEIVDIILPYSLSNRKVEMVQDQLVYQNFNGVKSVISMSEAKQLIEKAVVKRRFLLGTDSNGRDVLSRLIVGSRVSFSVGLISVIISLLIGVVLGALSGFYRGSVDNFIMWLINVFWAIPTILLAMGLMISIDAQSSTRILMVYIAVGLTMWVDTARLIRGQFLSLREMEFVEATKALGYSNRRIIFKHILPNCVGPLIVITASNFAAAILIESGLSYIGLGVQPPQPSWGSMLKEYFGYIGTSKSYLALFPGFAIMVLVFAFNLIGNGLRDAFDVKSKE